MSDASTNVLDLYDTEVLKIESVHLALQARARSKKLNFNDFEREIKDRFAEIGFEVAVNWYRYSVDGVEQENAAMPEITITGRTAPIAFDPDRRVHEAVHNVLELPGEEGWIKTSDAAAQRLLRGSDRGRKH